MKRKLLIAVVASLLVSTILSACASSAESAGSSQSAASGQSAGNNIESGQNSEGKTAYLGIFIQNTNSEYWNQLAEGAMIFAKDMPNVEATVFSCGSDDETQLKDINAFIAAHGQDSILFVDPSSDANAASIAQICDDAGVYWSSTWVCGDLDPADFEYWVIHQLVYGVTQGYENAKYLFEAMGGEGKVLAIGGIPTEKNSNDRDAGLMQALEEYPNVELLDMQHAYWEMQKALDITEAWLGKYEDVDAIWCASDGMALGAIEALKAKGIKDDVLVCGVDGQNNAIQAIIDGDLLCTWSNNGYFQGAYGAAWAYAAWNGDIDVSSMERKQRKVYSEDIFVCPDNAEQYKAEMIDKLPDYDFTSDWPNCLNELVKAYVEDIED